jgi:hypothetical protein
VVLGLKVKFENITLLSLNLLRVELVVAGGSDLDGLGGGEVSHSSRGEQSLERKHVDCRSCARLWSSERCGEYEHDFEAKKLVVD